MSVREPASEPPGRRGAPDLVTASTRPRVAILVVNGFRRRGRWGAHNREQALKYPWIELCLERVERHSGGWDYEVFAFDNSHLPPHREAIAAHERVRLRPPGAVAALGRAADRLPASRVGKLLERSQPAALDYLARKVPSDFEYIVTLDNDSFPVRDDWLEVLVGACEGGAALAGVYRDEMAPEIAPFIHVSGLCVRRQELLDLGVSFGRDARPEVEHDQDVGQRITYELSERGRTIAPLARSNAVNVHFLLGGLYGDVVYHHGAGSRKGMFWTSTDRANDERVNLALRAAAFADLDHLIAVLRGEAENDLGLTPM